MARGAKPAKVKVEAKKPVARKAPAKKGSGVGELEQRLAEALGQQEATSKILRVISQSPTDVLPVFDTIAAAALRLCRATSANVYTFDGELIHLVPLVHQNPGYIEAMRRVFPRPPSRDTAVARAILTCSVVAIPDVLKDAEYKIEAAALAGGFRSGLAVPLVREGSPIGAIVVGRPEPGPFSDNQIALLQTFADQAVIAIENVRLFNETKEALDQQTATAEVLQAISASPGNLQPVFDTLVRAAAKFCGAPEVLIERLDNDVLRCAASVGTHAEGLKRGFGSLEAAQVPLTKGSVAGRAVLERRSVYVHDLAAESEEEYPEGRMLQRHTGSRTMVATPLLREGVALGAILLIRTEVKPFSDKQLQLLRIFADQAVIAIENVRLFHELEVKNRDLTEALEQQTATSDILRVISQSPTDVQPVFDTIAAAALKLCRASSGAVLTFDGELIHLAAIANVNPEGADAVRKVFPKPPSRDMAATRAVLTCSVVAISDVLEDHEFGPRGVAVATGFRSALAVPLVREGSPIGVIVVGRPEPGPFPDKQIALLQTFADQAVIAIENVRLFNETKEALERQTATAEILRVIASSPSDEQPVFEVILDRATKLCDAETGMLLRYEN